MSKRNPEDVLHDIEGSAMDDEIDRVLAMSPEERRRELLAAGVDVDKLNAQADEFHEKLQRGDDGSSSGSASPAPAPEPPPAPASIDKARARRTRMMVSLALAATLGVLYATTGDILSGHRRPTPAEDLRGAAAKECDEALWTACLRDLDSADRLDPAGAGDERVKALREKATKALSGGGK